MQRIGLDLGTKHIVLSRRDDKGAVSTKYEVNGYLIMPRVDAFTKKLLQKQGVPFVERGNELIAIGKKAEQLAFSFNKSLSRPMAEGAVSKSDDDSQEIIAIIIRGIIGKLNDDAILYYCTTAKPINNDNLNVDFHKKIVKLIVEGYQGEAKISAHHINEARCLILEEMGEAVGISWGAGTVTVCAARMGVVGFEFSVVGSGDWVDLEVAKRFGYDPRNPDKDATETPTTVCRRKESIDLNKMPSDNVGKAIYLMYEILVENVVKNIIKGFGSNRDKFRFEAPVPIVNSGGTSMPPGFIPMVEREFAKYKEDSPLPVGEIRHVGDPLFAVANGCMLAAEMHE
jgi:hypothetical protein